MTPCSLQRIAAGHLCMPEGERIREGKRTDDSRHVTWYAEWAVRSGYGLGRPVEKVPGIYDELSGLGS